METFRERKIKRQMIYLQNAEKKFLERLENFSNEVKIVTECVCADLIIDHAKSQSERLLFRIKKAPIFWSATQAAFQVATYITLGRIFDKNQKSNLLVADDCESLGPLETGFPSNP